MNVQLNDSGVPIIREKTLAQKIKGVLIWTILIILTIAAGLLVYLCMAGASEMNAMTTFKQISDHPYYTMDYDGYDYTDMLNEELTDNNQVVNYYKEKLFTKALVEALPGEVQKDTTPKGSVAFFSYTYINTYMKGRIYNAYDTPLAMVVSTPKAGYKSWNIVDLADVGVYSGTEVNQWYDNAFQIMAASYATSEGINQEGLSVSLISCPVAECEDTVKVDITPFMAVRLILDRAATVENAVDVLEDYDINFDGGTYHLFVSERSEKSAIIEYIGGEIQVTYFQKKDNNSHQVCSTQMASSTAAIKDFSNMYSEEEIHEFFDKALTSAESGGSGMAPGYALQLLKRKSSDYADTSEVHFGTRKYGTQYVVLYDISKEKMYFIVGNDDKTQSYTYDLTV